MERSEEGNETREHTAASSNSMRPGSPSALQLNPTPLRPSGARRLHSFSSRISLNGSRNLERMPDSTVSLSPHPSLASSLLPSFVSSLLSSSHPLFRYPAFPSRIKTSGFISFSCCCCCRVVLPLSEREGLLPFFHSPVLLFCLLLDRCAKLGTSRRVAFKEAPHFYFPDFPRSLLMAIR